MTKITISLFLAVLLLHVLAALLTYVTVSSGRYVEGNPATAMLQINYGMTGGLTLTLLQGTALSVIPLMSYLAMLKFSQSNLVPPFEKASTMKAVKYFAFPLALAVLLYLTTVAGVDAIHDLAMLLSNGKINLWSF